VNIDREFKSIIPALTTEEFAGLEQSVITEGCRDALVTWRGTLVDGHNRYEICTKHGIAYNVIEKEFDSRSKATEWIILNQFGRRNLSAYNRSLLALKLKPMIEIAVKENQIRKPIDSVVQTFVPQNNDNKTNTKVSKIAGVSYETIRKVEKIEEKAPEQIKEKIRSGEISIHQAYKTVRQEERKHEIVIERPKTVNGLYDVIYADPPWRYDFAEADNRAIENKYPSMDLEDIKNIKVPSEKDSVLFLWATAPKLIEALEVMKAWGFTYKTNAIWDKEIIGMGYWFRGQHELLLVGTKGSYSPPSQEDRESSVYQEKRTKHSKKPNHYYEFIEKAFPSGKYLEMFSRSTFSDKWTVWGNQARGNQCE